MLYRGQEHTVRVDVPPGPLSPANVDEMVDLRPGPPAPRVRACRSRHHRGADVHDHRPEGPAGADRRTREHHHPAGVTTHAPTTDKVDPFTAEMIKNGLMVACEEMFYAFGRTAMSPVIYEVLDYAVGIASAGGELVAQTPGVPGFTGVLDFVAADTLDKWGKEMRPGDVYVLNVPYRSGTHLNDVALVLPSFHKDDLLGLIINKGHWFEVGG